MNRISGFVMAALLALGAGSGLAAQAIIAEPLWSRSSVDESFVLVEASPDGAYVAMATLGYPGAPAVFLYPAKGGASGLVRMLKLGSDALSLSFSPDSSTIAIGTDGKGVVVYDLRTGKDSYYSPPGLGGRVFASFSADGAELRVGCGDGLVRVLDPATGKIVRTFSAGVGAVSAIATSGRTIALGGWEGSVAIVDPVKGTVARTMATEGRRVGFLRFSPDGATIAAALDEAPSTGPEGSKRDYPVRAWTVSGGNLRGQALPGSETLGSMAFTPDGKFLAVPDFDSVMLLSASDLSLSRRLPVGDGQYALHLAFSRDGASLFTAGRKTAARWRLSTGALEETIAAGHGRIAATAISADGSFVVTGDLGGQVLARDSATAAAIASFGLGSRQVIAIAVSPKGDRIAVAWEYGTVRIWDVERGMVLAETAVKYDAPSGRNSRPTKTLAFSADGRSLCAGTWSGAVRIYDGFDLSLRFEAKVHASGTARVAASPDGTRIASASESGELAILSASDGSALSRPSGHGTEVVVLRWSPDSRYIASIDKAGALRVTDASNGALVSGGKGLAGARDVVFLRNNAGFLVALGDRLALVDAASGAAVSVATIEASALSAAGDACVGGQERATAARITILAERSLGKAGASVFPAAVAWPGDSSRFRLFGLSGTASDWRLADGSVSPAPSLAKGDLVALDRAGRVAAVADAKRGWIEFLDAATGVPSRRVAGHPAGVYLLELSEDGSLALSAGYEGTLAVWNALTGASTRLAAVVKEYAGPACFAAGGDAVATVVDRTRLEFYGAADGRLLASRDLEASALASIGRDALLVGTEDGDLLVLDPRTGATKSEWSWDEEPPVSIVPSADGKRVAVSTSSMTRIYLVATGKELVTIGYGSRSQSLVSLSPDGRVLVVVFFPNMAVSAWELPK